MPKTSGSRKGRTRDHSIPGKMPRGQAISTYGVGSIYELRSHRGTGLVLHSVMIAGLDWWPEDNLRRIREPELEKSLGVRHFRLPPADENDSGSAYIPAVRFPRWLVCNRCSRLGKVPREFDDSNFGGPRCRAAGCPGKGVPVRLVMACYKKKDERDTDDGLVPCHIDDFPWAWWAHSKRKKTCSNPQLKLETTGNTTSISGLVVRCYSEECRGKTERSLEGVFGESALDAIKCRGSRPWLHDHEKGCRNKVRALLRGASNIYFPVTASAISIPPSSEKLQQIIFQEGYSVIQSVGKHSMEVVVDFLRNAIPLLGRYHDSEIISALEQLIEGRGRKPRTEKEQRSAERKAILRGRGQDKESGEFVAEPIPQKDFAPGLRKYIDCLVRVHRLREVRALRGFQRVIPFSEEDAFSVPVAPISRERKDWLPAIEVYGEGIYIEMNPNLVDEWASKLVVSERMAVLTDNFREANGGLDVENIGEQLPTARLVMIHTLSHLLMKQLALESGYAGASLRERLYVGRDNEGDDELGFLIYTAGAGADGTLGGLVRQGEPRNFEVLLKGALENARWCSSDPLCIESIGQGVDALNLAACHACALVSETSCERRNTLLDRALLIGLPGLRGIGYFEDILSD